MPGLPSTWRMQRLLILAVVALTVGFMIFVKPVLYSGLAWKPCGFYLVTGLPCPFCGGTRAARALLQGDFQRALYYNAIAYPALGATALAMAALLFEAVTGIPVFRHIARIPHRQAILLALSAALIAWWGWHIADAVRTPKPELISPSSPVCHFLLTHTHAGWPDSIPSPPR